MDTLEAVGIVLDRFGALSAVPRGSGHEAGARAHLEAWAQARGFAHRRDGAGNLVVQVPAPSDLLGVSPVVLQGHLDMVCEKRQGSRHDFSRDPIALVRDGDWLRARDTTLGADNGIGVALAMALAEDRSLRRPALELLFTVEEETGLRGAASLDPALLAGRSLVNLDSEADGVLTVGCAGGADAVIDLRMAREPAPSGGVWQSLTVGGATGGHSGVDIHHGRANANLLLARALEAVLGDGKLRISSVEGGSARNAIPRDAAAMLWVPQAEIEAFTKSVQESAASIRDRYASTDPALGLEARRADRAPQVFAARDSQTLIRLLLALPNGVAGCSRDFPGTVETSNNIGVVRTTPEGVQIVSSQRSSSAPALRELTGRLESVAALAGATAHGDPGYPPWQPAMGSPLLGRARKAWRARHTTGPEVRIIHAGLECAVIGARCPGMDMISVGPTIEGAHSPDERLYVPSLQGVWDLLAELLESFTR